MVDEHTTGFYQLMARNDSGETEDQLISRYIGGFQIQYQDTLNMFDLYSVSDAHQKALQLEGQAKRRSSVLPWPRSSSRGVAQQEIVHGRSTAGGVASKPPIANPVKPVTVWVAILSVGNQAIGLQSARNLPCKRGCSLTTKGWLKWN